MDEREPLVIWGAGAMGGTFGAFLARAGEPVLLVDQVAEHVAAMNAQGLELYGPEQNFVVPVRAVMPADLTGRYSRIALAVKAHHTEAAARSLAPHLADDGFVLSLQNGLNELVIADVVGLSRTMGCFINYSADYHAPGRIMYSNRGAVAVGEMDGAMTPRLADMHRLLKILEPDAVATDNITGYLWGKLAYGAQLVATALTNASMTENFEHPRYLRVWTGIAREVMAVAAAQGIRPLGFNGFSPEAYLPGASDEAAEKSVAALAEFNRHSAKSHSGIWRDLAVRKRRTEVPAQIGMITDIGAKVGVATPMIERLVALIVDIEDGRRPQDWTTLDQLLEVAP
ncbi:MAG: 2-dehydropantoate 2-reductase [Hyphomicrobiaceae bacterium]